MPSPHRTLTPSDVRELAERCFAPAEADPPGEQIGLELEWHAIAAGRPDERLDLDALRAAATDPGPLPAGGTLSFEPGGQLELNTAPLVGLDEVCAAAHLDAAELSRRMERVGVGLVPIGLDAGRPPHRVLHTGRYDAMEAAFDAKGPHGRRMMCNTAALQVNLDLGPGDPAVRWRRAHALGPTLVALFANSPFGAEAGVGRPSGWVANRLATWWGIDPSRTAAPALGPDPAESWARYALAANVLLIRGTTDGDATPLRTPFPFARWMDEGHEQGWPTVDDLAYHLTTLFPPVRPRGWLELRMLDALDADTWPVAVAVLVALLLDPAAGDAADEATRLAAGRWSEAAEVGLADPDLARSADGCIAAALDALPRLGASTGACDAVAGHAERYV
ncbi:MAG: hypothetical protein KDB35_23880, partial [Acidimicrobiales bacterium]|nr:hypothetical protein [Acidimicrobiales bacterium]